MIKKIFFTVLSFAATISHAQNVGIGTTAPLTKLHVSNGSSGNGSTNSNRIATFEAASSSYIQLLNPTANESGILAGNTTSLIKSGIVFPSDSSISLRAGGNSTRIHINKFGATGIGTTDPQGRLHVSNGTLSNAQYLGTSMGIFENSNTFSPSTLQLMNPSTMPFSIISGTDLTFSRSSLSFQADSSLTFETGSGGQRMKIDKTGLVTIPNRLGIGNTDPFTKLHVVNNGSLANAQYSSGAAVSIFESGSTFFNGVIQLMTPSTRPFSIVSGTEITTARSSISFQADSSLTFESGFSQQMKIDKAGFVTIPNRVGIGNTSPVAKLHIVNNGSLANAQYTSSFTAAGVFESGSTFFNGVIQLMNPSTRPFSIASGTELTSLRSSVSFQADSSVTFETGAGAQQMKFDKTGELEVPFRIGIGTTSPQTKLHVINGALANAQYANTAFTPAIFESNFSTTSFLQLMNPSTRDFKIASGTELHSYRSGISFQADSSLGFETNGQNQRMKIDKIGIVSISGSLGIGTTAPSASLDVSGTTVIGVNGTVLTEVIKLTVNKDVASVSANASGLETFAVTNAQLNSTVYVSPASALADGLIIAYARVSLAGVVEVKFVNTTAAAINPSAMNFFITVIR